MVLLFDGAADAAICHGGPESGYYHYVSLSSHSLHEAHPYSLASPSHMPVFAFHIQGSTGSTGWTHALRTKLNAVAAPGAVLPPPVNLKLSNLLRGDIANGTASINSYNTIVIHGSGSGIAPMLSVFTTMLALVTSPGFDRNLYALRNIRVVLKGSGQRYLGFITRIIHLYARRLSQGDGGIDVQSDRVYTKAGNGAPIVHTHRSVVFANSTDLMSALNDDGVRVSVDLTADATFSAFEQSYVNSTFGLNVGQAAHPHADIKVQVCIVSSPLRDANGEKNPDRLQVTSYNSLRCGELVVKRFECARNSTLLTNCGVVCDCDNVLLADNHDGCACEQRIAVVHCGKKSSKSFSYMQDFLGRFGNNGTHGAPHRFDLFEEGF
jgi:hypothetical protein